MAGPSEGVTIDGYTLTEVAAEKVRCVTERVQCRDLYDLHQLLDGDHVVPLEAWYLYLRKTENALGRGRQRTLPQAWSTKFERRMVAYRDRWHEELHDYMAGEVPSFDDVKRQIRHHLVPLLDAAHKISR